jgi:hypothetical protein
MDQIDPKDIDLTEGLPDARLQFRRKRTEIPGPFGKFYELCFCVNCGRNGGAVTKEWSPHVFYLCQDCADKWGTLPMPQVPDELVR